MRRATFGVRADPCHATGSHGGGGGGIVVPIVGTSGAGKDSLIRYAHQRLGDRPEFVFVRGTVTRAADPSGEDHHSTDPAPDEALVREGRLALWWEAHGIRYGLPESLRSDVDSGKVVVAKASRQVLPYLRAQFPRVCVIAVSAHPEVVAARLAAREDAGGHEKRRSPLVVEEFGNADSVWIENSGPLTVAGDRLVDVLGQLRLECAAPPARPPGTRGRRRSVGTTP